MFFVPRTGSLLEMPFLVAILKKCEVENDADGLKTYFPIDFGIIFLNFRQIFFVGRGGLGGYRILFLYVIKPPIFPKGVTLFSTWPYFQLPITRPWRPLF